MAKRIMRKLRISEISGVDRPAQAGARSVIMKRADDVEKRMWLTSSTNGHQHLVNDIDYDGVQQMGGSTSEAKTESEADNGASWGHTHPWVRNADGTISIGEVEGHTHDILEQQLFKDDQAGREPALKQETVMTEEEKKALADAQKAAKAAEDVAKKLADELGKANALATMNDAQKALYNKADEAGKVAFLKLDDAGRQAEVAKSLDGNPVVYTDMDGSEYRKSDDPRLLAMAKGRDLDRKANEEIIKRAEVAEFTKQAGDVIAHLPGDVTTVKVPLLKAISKLDDVAKAGALALLTAGETAIAKGFKTLGANGQKEVAKGSEVPTDEMEKGAREHLKSMPAGTSYEKAYDSYLQTPAGRELYTKSLKAA